MRSLRLLSASVFSLLALGAMSAPSQAETGPHWFVEGKLLAGETVHANSKITESFSLNFPPAKPETTRYECSGRNGLTISNPPGGGPGIDEIVSFRLTGCTEVRIPGRCDGRIEKATPLGLPWRGHLAVEPPSTVIDVFEGVTLELTCNKRSFRGVFSGTLRPEIFGGSELSFGGAFCCKAELLSGALGQVEIEGGEVLRGPRGHKKITVA